MDLLNNIHSGNGMITKIWGPPAWVTFHAISFGYPMKPSPEQKLNYRQYYEAVGDTLPCRYCRESYKGFTQSGDTVLDDRVFENRESLSRWAYRLHEAVNRKLGVNYGVSYEDVVKRYESYRAKCDKSIENEKAKGCVMPLDKKKQPFAIAETKECPIIPKYVARRFMQYGQVRGLKPKHCLYMNLDIEKMEKTDPVLVDRNKYCTKLISKMRREGIPSLETSGPWEGLPTLPELKLILARCSMMPQRDLEEINPNYESTPIPRYQFVF